MIQIEGKIIPSKDEINPTAEIMNPKMFAPEELNPEKSFPWLIAIKKVNKVVIPKKAKLKIKKKLGYSYGWGGEDQYKS